MKSLILKITINFIGPASPIIEDLQSFSDGLDISWKSDVTSRQEKYVVVYVRNDTGALYLSIQFQPFHSLMRRFLIKNRICLNFSTYLNKA